MKFKAIALGAALSVAVQGALLIGDAGRGAEIFKSQHCVTCHSVGGEGGKVGPELGRQSSRGYTPSELAALMWNHAPAMWSAMEKANVVRPQLNSQQSADLFAYFYAARYFEKKGDAARGRKAFVDKGCSQCHNISAGGMGAGPEVMKWDSVSDPIELARQMWNHSGKMKEAMKVKGVKFPQLTSAEMNDVVIYLQTLPQAKKARPQFSPASAETGETLFTAKGCVGCHKGDKSLPKPGSSLSAVDFAAAMWNHPVQVKQSTEMRPEEMTRLVGYLWAKQFATDGGSAARGVKVFDAKGCAGCHTKGPGPKLALGDRANSYEIISVLWAHGPAMQKEMRGKGVNWPRFENTEMADLLGYLRQGR